jgi:hypothetical protein
MCDGLLEPRYYLIDGAYGFCRKEAIQLIAEQHIDSAIKNQLIRTLISLS